MKTLIQFSAVLLLTSLTFAQNPDSLRSKFARILEGNDATVGIAVQGFDGKDTVSINGDNKFPLQSVYKFHIALVVLNDVDSGKFSLAQDIKIGEEDLTPDIYSPIRDKYPDGVAMKLSEIIRYTVAESDNIGCDVLLKLIGGPEVVEEFVHNMNINDIAIKYNEKIQQSRWENQFENWTTPKAANQVLVKFYQNKNKLLSDSSYNFLLNTMKGTITGKNSIKGKLPGNAIVAHKTGHSGTNKEGVTAAVNDIGIVFLPDGRYFYLSVFVSDSKENEETNQKIIADIARAAWDYFNNE